MLLIRMTPISGGMTTIKHHPLPWGAGVESAFSPSHIAVNSKVNGKMVAAGGEVIRISGVSHNFSTAHNRNLALDDVTVSMPPGVMTLLHGVSGSGKTTLLNIVSGLLRPTSGTVFVEGSDIYSLSTPERDDMRLNRIGMIFQEHSLIADFTARENVELILRVRGFGSRSRTMATEALERVGIAHLQGRYPRQLSGGEAQRVGIARAIAGDRALLLADEPTGQLDRRNSQLVFELLRELAEDGEGRTVVLSSHDPTAKEYAHRSCELVDGHLEGVH